MSAAGQIFNAAAVVHRGRIAGIVPKEKLPTYNVFYEGRTFSRGGPGLALDAGGVPLGDYRFAFEFGDVAVEVCEDAWSPDGPMRRRCYSGAEIVVNVSTSPYRMGVDSTRREMLATRAADNQALLLYANAVGGQDGLIYDGGGFIFQNGRLVFEAPRFVEGWWSTVVDLDRTRRLRMENTTWRSDCEAFRLQQPMVPVIRIDAADRGLLDARLPRSRWRQLLPAAAPAAGRRRADGPARARARRPVRGAGHRREELLREDRRLQVARHRAVGRTRLDADAAGRLARVAADRPRARRPRTRALRLLHAEPALRRRYEAGGRSARARSSASRCRTIPIHDAIEREIAATVEMLGGQQPTELTRQNIQARIRGQRMWNWANSSGALFLQTGDMSEKAVGYTTIGGDLEGALSVIANVPKTVVIALLQRLETRFGFKGVSATLQTEPGPELADQPGRRERADAVPGSRRLPASLCGREDVAGRGRARRSRRCSRTIRPRRWPTGRVRFTTLFSQSIYKWVQSPLSLHVGSLDLDRERALQMPVVQKNEWF